MANKKIGTLADYHRAMITIDQKSTVETIGTDRAELILTGTAAASENVMAILLSGAVTLDGDPVHRLDRQTLGAPLPPLGDARRRLHHALADALHLLPLEHVIDRALARARAPSRPTTCLLYTSPSPRAS